MMPPGNHNGAIPGSIQHLFSSKEDRVKRAFPQEYEHRTLVRGKNRGKVRYTRPRERAWRAWRDNVFALQCGDGPIEGSAVDQLEPNTAETLRQHASSLADGLFAAQAPSFPDWASVHGFRRAQPAGNILFDTTQTGGGKSTQHTAPFIAEQQAAGRTVVFVTVRQELAEATARQSEQWHKDGLGCLPLMSYKGIHRCQHGLYATERRNKVYLDRQTDFDPSQPHYAGLAVCVNSLPNIVEACKDNVGDVAFVLDEAALMLNSMCIAGQTSGNGIGKAVLAALQVLISSPDTPVLCLDATAGRVHLELLAALAQRPVVAVRKACNPRPPGTWNQPDTAGSPVSVFLSGSGKADRRQLIKACVLELSAGVQAGQTCYLALDSKQALCEVVSEAVRQGVSRSDIAVLARIESQEQKQALAGCEVLDSVAGGVNPGRKLIVFTSLVSVGTSFNDTPGVFNGVLSIAGRVGPEWILQAMGRARQAHNASAWIAVNHLVPNMIGSDGDDRAEPPNMRDHSRKEIIALAASYLENARNAQALVRWTLPLLLEWNGYTVAYIGATAANDGDVAEVNKDDRTEAINELLAVTPAPKDKNQRKKYNQYTPQQIEARMMRTWLGREDITHADVELWLKLSPEARGAVLLALGRNMGTTKDGSVVTSLGARAVAKVLKEMFAGVLANDIARAVQASRRYCGHREASLAADMGICTRNLVNMRLRGGNSIGGVAQWLVGLGFKITGAGTGRHGITWPEHFPAMEHQARMKLEGLAVSVKPGQAEALCAA